MDHISLLEDKTSLLELTKIAEKAQRFDDMLVFVKKAVVKGSRITVNELDLFSNALLASVGTRRNAMRSVLAFESDARRPEGGEMCGENYCVVIEGELRDICTDTIRILDECLNSTATTGESVIFCMKAKADCHRYLSEFEDGVRKIDAVQAAGALYEEATELAFTELNPVNPTRLGLFLNYAVFLCDICSDSARARKVIEAVLEKVGSVMDEFEGIIQDNSKVILQLMRENLAVWSATSFDDASLGTEEKSHANSRVPSSATGVGSYEEHSFSVFTSISLPSVLPGDEHSKRDIAPVWTRLSLPENLWARDEHENHNMNVPESTFDIIGSEQVVLDEKDDFVNNTNALPTSSSARSYSV